jgi:cytochrome c-type biogenesis protein CcmH
MIVFWIVAGVLSAAAAGLVLHRAAAAPAGPDDAAAPVYRRQLAEIEELAARGLIADTEKRSAEAEAGRRLLSAASHAEPSWTTAGRRTVLAVAALAPVLAAALYFAVGSPGYGDQPFAQRLAAWEAADPSTLTPPQMAVRLERLSRKHPDEPEVFRFLAMAEMMSGDAPEAIRALRRAAALAPERADLWEMMGVILTTEADGVPTPDARTAFREALIRDPNSVGARFHLARARVLDGDKAGGLADLQALTESLPSDDGRRTALAGAIAELQGQPAAPPAPAAIQGMVAGLAARLEGQPNDPEGWVRLVRSYAVLGDAARRDAALQRARTLFKNRPDIAARLDEAARAEPIK